jgi:hypothetical protein
MDNPGKIIKGIKNKKKDNGTNISHISHINSIRSIKSTLKTDTVKKEILNDDNRIEEVNGCDTSFVFKHNRSNGNYSVYDGNLKKIQFAIKNVYIPYNIEEYNNSFILKLDVDCDSDDNRDTLDKLKDIDYKLQNLRSITKNIFKNCYNVADEPTIDEDMKYYCVLDNKEQLGNKYRIRTHLKSNLKITHSKFFGTYDKAHLKGKTCDVNIEMGSVWKTDDNYGCTVYILSIKVLN